MAVIVVVWRDKVVLREASVGQVGRELSERDHIELLRAAILHVAEDAERIVVRVVRAIVVASHVTH
jgi:hypothetical protein